MLGDIIFNKKKRKFKSKSTFVYIYIFFKEGKEHYMLGSTHLINVNLLFVKMLSYFGDISSKALYANRNVNSLNINQRSDVTSFLIIHLVWSLISLRGTNTSHSYQSINN